MITAPALVSARFAPRAAAGSATRTACLVITQWYPPEPARTGQRIAHSLRDSGLGVEVLTGMPHYPVGRVMTGYRASRPTREVRDGISILRTPEYPNHSTSVLGRMANYLSWAVSSALLGQRALRSADVALVYSSPATAGLPALVGRFLHGTPYVLLIQDLWPDSVFATGYGNALITRARGLLDLMCRALYRHASHICVISPGMVDVLVDRGVPRDKLTLVYNWQDEADAPAPLRSDDDHTGPVRVLYAGNHGPAQGLESLIRAAAACPTVELSLIGDGTDKPRLRELAQAIDATNVHFLGRVDKEQLDDLQRRFDVQVASLGTDPLFSYTMPSKVQGILVAGMPLLAIASGDVARVAEESGSGWAAPPGDVAAIQEALERVGATSRAELAQRGAKARQHYDEHMGRERNLARLREVLESARHNRRGVRR
ncbi:glycosyltransferase family 4 protein [Georgenia sp. H159]|uniref:glycosyltransferase family 4 protein n=1 Tax=Georgenia sp. H159 TaxID=3076115 RepID=UPI002D780E27|nr:glycosyltransferase family 4 protein [Georgenia sp. H159]